MMDEFTKEFSKVIKEKALESTSSQMVDTSKEITNRTLDMAKAHLN